MATITEDYVSFETAKLLKEKGFNKVECQNSPHFAYNMDGQFSGPSWDTKYHAPTLQMAMKWLREVHKLHIQIWILEENGYWFDIEKILNAQYKHKSLYSTGLEDVYFETYEQAAEAAVKYCLEHLI